MTDPKPDATGLKIDSTISIGHLMAAIPAIGILFSILWWIVGYASRTDDNARRIEALQAEMRAEIKELRDDQIKQLQTQLSVLPDLKAHLAGAERTIDEIKAVNKDQNDKLDDARRMAGQAVDLIKQLYQPEIPVRRTR